MIDDIFVIDAVAHAYDFSDENRIATCEPERYAGLQQFAYSSATFPPNRWNRATCSPRTNSPPAGAQRTWRTSFFVESDVDMIVHHSVAISSFSRDGVARFDTGVNCSASPRTGYSFTAVSTRSTKTAAGSLPAWNGWWNRVRWASNSTRPTAFFDVSKHKLVQMLYDDPERAFPFFEKARDLGVMHLAFHKAQPVGPGPVEAVHYEDISTAALAFPDMTFEVVHAGWAFLEEAGIQLMLHDNIYANLECVVNLVVRHPRRFAHILGTLLRYGGPDRILYATGCAVNHADPILEQFMAFAMPPDLVDGYGYPELTPGVKRQMLGANIARIHDIDIPSLSNRIRGDRWSRLRAGGKAPPWSAHRASLAGAGVGVLKGIAMAMRLQPATTSMLTSPPRSTG